MKSFVRAGAVAGLTVLGAAWSGAAYADTDAGSSRDQSRGQAGKSAEAGQSSRPNNKKRADDMAALDAAKAKSAIRDEIEKFAPVADLASAADMRDSVEDTASFTVSAAAQQAVLGPGGPVPTVGMGGLVPNARALAAYIATKYPSVQAIGGVRSDPLPDHPSGHAIDIMIGADMGLGDVINADVQRQAERFGVSYSLWLVPNHFNHVHVTVF